jgi:hypothetical protein
MIILNQVSVFINKIWGVTTFINVISLYKLNTLFNYIRHQRSVHK